MTCTKLFDLPFCACMKNHGPPHICTSPPPPLIFDRSLRPRGEVYIFHANYTDLIPEGIVGCSSRIELVQNKVCRCHKLTHESIAAG